MYGRMIILLIALLSSVSTATYASSCANFIKKAKTDIDAMSKDNTPPSWLTLANLQKVLGQTNKNESPDGKYNYKWVCPENSEIYISVITTTNDVITKVVGEFSDDNGVGMFSAIIQPTAMNINPESAAVTPTTVSVTPTVTQSKVENTNSANSKSCSELFKQIIDEEDPIKKMNKMKQAGQTDNQKPLWDDFAMLKKILGEPQVKENISTLTIWDSYAIYTDNGFLKTKGSPPAGLTSEATIEEVSRVLGPPKKSLNESTYNNSWTCPGVGIMTVVTDKKNNALSMSISGAAIGTIAIANMMQGSEIQAEFNRANDSPVTDANDTNGIMKSYNQYFNTTFTKPAEGMQDALSRIKTYYSALRSCMPGTYKYIYAAIFTTSEIEAMKDGICNVQTTYTHMGSGLKQSRICKYTPASLATFTDKEAEDIGRGGGLVDNQGIPMLSELQKKECQN